MKLSIKLWTINKFLRFTGFRLFVDVDKRIALDPVPEDLVPTVLSIRWYGWGFLKE